MDSQRPLLVDLPDIVVGTPSRLLAHIRAGNLDLRSSLETLVIDEADLVFSFGYEDDVKAVLAALPSIYQVGVAGCFKLTIGFFLEMTDILKLFNVTCFVNTEQAHI